MRWAVRVMVVLAIVLAGLCVRSAVSLRTVRSEHASVVEEQEMAERLAREVATLKESPQVIRASAPDEAELFSRVADVLATAGVTPGTVRVTVTPQGETAVFGLEGAPGSGSRYRRRSVQIDLQPISVPHVGAFLARWRVERPEWVPSKIDLTPVLRVGGGRGDRAFAARITLTSTYARPDRAEDDETAPRAMDETRREP